MSLATYFLAKYIKKQIVARRTRRNQKIGFNTATSEPIDLTRYAGTLGDDADGELGLKLPLFEFSTIAGTTNNFDDSHKLGEGGFGPVYKGKLPKGQGIAVKRLSKKSVQGLEEFMSEVILISNLQHRNLVSLLGCCIDGEEKLLLYELMPNKSLDAFLFDAKKKELLDWPRRYNIIEGIARGLLYLHRDSRLRIIHRDLKAANILLDEQFNAKISDFGLARMFCGDQIEATTQKVIGTFGYMSPEYAMDGHFSEKSDVFSFGVLLLEIVSGKRNINHLDREHYTNLLGYTWTLWNDNKVYELVDPSLSNSMSMQQVLKCIHVGLLCVQEYPCDRPTMSLVVSMLNTHAILPTPKQVAFYGKRSHSELTSYSEDTEICSVNHLIVTNLDCR